jgi:glycerol kinase
MMVPAFTGLGAPHWQPDARSGTITAWTRHHRPATATRPSKAAYQSAGTAAGDAGTRWPAAPRRWLSCGRYACVNDLLMNRADLLASMPAVTETTALGAAYLAGLSSYAWGARLPSRRFV